MPILKLVSGFWVAWTSSACAHMCTTHIHTHHPSPYLLSLLISCSAIPTVEVEAWYGSSNSHLASSFLLSVVPEAHRLPHSLGGSLIILGTDITLVRKPQLRVWRNLYRAWRERIRAPTLSPSFVTKSWPDLSQGRSQSWALECGCINQGAWTRAVIVKPCFLAFTRVVSWGCKDDAKVVFF